MICFDGGANEGQEKGYIIPFETPQKSPELLEYSA
jgi:hypothetical protein